ncbi:NAD-specific glutamate dehydrogenase [compost metagenome]
MADAPEDMDARVNLWLDQHRVMVNRWRAMLDELRAATGTDYAMYAVANRELVDLAMSGQAAVVPS